MSIYAPSFFKLSDADYIPKRREVSAVSNAAQAEVTTTEDHGYEIGKFVRLHIPSAYGMALDSVKAKILTIPTTTTFTVDVDTTNLSSYSTPAYPPGFTQSHVVPITGVEENIA